MPMDLRQRNSPLSNYADIRPSGKTGLGFVVKSFNGVFICCLLLLVSGTYVSCKDTNFTFTNFTAGSVTLVGDSRVVNGRIRVVNISDIAIDSQQNSDGRALYPNPVQFRDPATKAVASFKTSFQFSIDTNKSRFSGWTPSGLAWGIFPDNYTIGEDGLYLGLMNYSNDNFLANHIFAIEVDTGYSDFGAYKDISSCHVGVDLITMNSKPVFDMASPQGSNVSLCVQDRGVYTLNVEYNGLTHGLLVNLLDVGGISVANISYTIDLYPYLIDEMYVGFSSGAIYYQPQEVTILSWGFSSTFAAPVLAPAPAQLFPPSPSAPGPATSNPPGADLGIAPDTNNCLRNLTSCSTDSSTKSNNVIIYAAAGGGGAVLLLIGLGLGCLCVRRGSKDTRSFDQEAIPGGVAVVGPRRFTYKELNQATKNFNQTELLGQGGSGSVYRGILRDSGAMVAVKVIQAERSREMAEKEFQAEVSIINQIRHRNLVQLQGWCNDKGMLCLVYEYLPNGSLDGLLRKELQAPNTVLPWGTRFNILTGVASALAYLHEEIGQCILHRDLKPGNVLLDVNYNACLADFGLARLIDHDQVAPTTMLAGTLGYMAPEMPHTGRATTQTDVYAFGVLIVEMLCGRRPTDVDRDTQKTLLDCVWMAHAGNDIMCIVDSKIRDDPLERQIERTLLLGLLCCHPDPDRRPSMRNARQILTGDSPLPPIPSEKPLVYGHYASYAELEVPVDNYNGPPSVSINSSKASSNYHGSNPTSDYYNSDYSDSFSSQSKSFFK
ncbi:hypothetical protein KC19_6G175200 [Ceratodon purpureus]|uniref:Protein kinase domain-containing protein n=1 Tax=Ceratodon purpureus TaxID=3225 RepID=A0A8T0HFS1_CERPU|nr:hypothetical protein KC19_6G175200 [Ceratodon purpureus]